MSGGKLTKAEKQAFAAGWNARETGSGHRADGLESCLGMYERGFNFGDADTGEDLTRPSGRNAQSEGC